MIAPPTSDLLGEEGLNLASGRVNFYYSQKNGNLHAVVSMSIGDPCGLEWELLSANRLVVIILMPTYFKHQKVYCNLRISKRLQYWPPKRPRIAV